MAKSSKSDTDDSDLFRRSIGSVRKISHDRVQHPHQRPAPRPRMIPDEELPLAGPGFSDGSQVSPVSAEDTLFFARPGLQQRLLKRLRRGQLPVEAELDMHGMTIPVAENELVRFLSLCRDQHIRCVRIIHGKGYGSRAGSPILKNRLNHWLRQHHDVLAFTTTPRDAGGAGAMYVLLRSRRPD
jgi:DNA-nicking Smr family endonuclease